MRIITTAMAATTTTTTRSSIIPVEIKTMQSPRIIVKEKNISKTITTITLIAKLLMLGIAQSRTNQMAASPRRRSHNNSSKRKLHSRLTHRK